MSQMGASMAIADIQRALTIQGFDPGAIDGIWGRRSIKACKAFQAARGLPVTGLLDQATLSALSGTPIQAAALPLPWMVEAQALIGVREVPGPGNNPEILNWAKVLGIEYERDVTPWCGLLVAHCIGATLPEEPLPSGPLWARSWQKFGQGVQPGVGAVLVFWRGAPDGSDGHVGFYEGERGGDFLVLGGNQADKVCRAFIPKSRLLKARWPTSADPAACVARLVDVDAEGNLTEA